MNDNFQAAPEAKGARLWRAAMGVAMPGMVLLSLAVAGHQIWVYGREYLAERNLIPAAPAASGATTSPIAPAPPAETAEESATVRTVGFQEIVATYANEFSDPCTVYKVTTTDGRTLLGTSDESCRIMEAPVLASGFAKKRAASHD